MRIAVILMGLALTVSAAAQAETMAIQVRSAIVEHDDQMGPDRVNVRLTRDGQRNLAAFTKERVGRTIHLRVDGRLLASPTVMSPLQGDSLQLSPGAGGFGETSAQEIAKRLNASGAMDVSDDK